MNLNQLTYGYNAISHHENRGHSHSFYVIFGIEQLQ